MHWQQASISGNEIYGAFVFAAAVGVFVCNYRKKLCQSNAVLMISISFSIGTPKSCFEALIANADLT